MTTQEIAAALQRVEAVVRRRPDVAMHEESPATARWEGGRASWRATRNGTKIASDLPREFGGAGDDITPGWLFRAGFASCTATCIVMAAAAKGIELASLEVLVTSRSDIRGVLGIADAEGAAGACGAARRATRRPHLGPRGRARAIAKRSSKQAIGCSPISTAVRSAVPVDLQIEVGAS